MSKYKMVPVEPTADMVIAGEDAWDAQLDKRLFAKENGEPFATYPSEETHELCSRVAYRAMLAAAPAVTAEPVGWVTEDTVDGQTVNGKPRRIWWENNEGVGIPIYATPQPSPTTQGEPVAWLPYLTDRADGVTGHYAIARKNPAGYREVWNLRSHHWAAFSDEVLTLDEALAILKKLEMPTAPKPSSQLPEFATDPDDSDEGASLWDHGFKRGWNTCLKAVTNTPRPVEQQDNVPDGWRSRFLKLMGEIQSELDNSDDDPIPLELWSLWRELLDTVPQPAEQQPRLVKYQPCGCVVCTCEHETHCQGCGSHHCGTHPVGQLPAPAYLQPAPDELFVAEFNAWWDEHGQFCRAGGGTYERSFAFEAWRHLYPQLTNLRMAAEEQQPTIPNEHGKNRYGLDMSYFRNLFNRELNRPLVDFKPSELARVLARASRTADPKVMHETEFQIAEQKPAPDEAALVEALEACRDELLWMIDRHNQQDQSGGSWLYDYQTVVEADAALAAHRNGNTAERE